MSDYISREAAIAYIREQSEEWQKAFEEFGGESGIYADAYNDLAEDFHRIPAADVEPVQRWILCKDRPPKECGRYQAVVESEAFHGSSYIDTLSYDKFGWCDGCCYVNGVSHWMPLPKLPTRKDDDGK